MQKSLENYLEADDGAGKILAHARLLIKLARLYQEIAPANLARASRVANYKSKIIVIHADSGTLAAKLRQIAPTLSDGFAKRGVECNGLEVKVQVLETRAQSRASTQKPLTVRASGALEGLRDTLPASPLRAALETFLSRTPRQE